MKNIKRVLMLMLVLSVLLCATAFAADNTIEDIDVVASGVTVSGYAGSENFKLSYSEAIENGMYLVFVLKDQGLPTVSNILYIDQATANSSGVTFDNIYPSEIENDESYIYLTGGAESGMKLLGTIVPTGAAVEDVTVNVVGKEGSMPAYTVNGNTVTVTYSLPCKMGYLNADGTYTAIAATANADGSYSYVIPENVGEVTLVVKGDVNGDGTVTLADSTRIKAAVNNKVTLTAIALFASDANNDNGVTLADSTRVKAVSNKKTSLTW